MVRDADSPNETKKQHVRTQHLRQRATRSAAERERVGEALAAHAAAEPTLARAQRVAIYLAMATEPPTELWIAQLLAAGRSVIVPVVTGDSLDWAELTGDEQTMFRSALGTAEPAGPRLGSGAVTRCDVVIVPALAADPYGNRLGRGAGYYDRAITGLQARVTAVVFASELIAQVPAEPHDQPVQSVLTEHGLMRTTAREAPAADADRSTDAPHSH